MIRQLLLDIDDTLLDFHSAFVSTQERIARLLKVEPSEAFRALDEECDWRAWRESGLENTESKDVQRHYHRYYLEYVRSHYRHLREALGVAFDIDEAVACYLDSIAHSAVLKEPCALEVYRALAAEHRMVLATNGGVQAQRQRMSAFLPYTYRMYISEEMGVIKPMREYFDFLLRDLRCSPEECLMIGDSLVNDIAGAKKAGMDGCFYNPKHRPIPDSLVCDFEISSLTELTRILQVERC